MAQVATDYTILSRTQLNRYDPATQQAVEGWDVQARWTRSGTVLKVFVPLATYSATEVDTAIRQAGALDDQVGALGASSPRSG